MNKHRAIDFPHQPRESELHASVAELLSWVLIPPAMFSTFPAGWGKLSKATAGRLYAAGMKKGMPDILVFSLHQGISLITKVEIAHTKIIGIELKAGANSLTPAQRTMHAQLQAVGIRVYVCRSQEDVLAALDDADITRRQLNLQGVA